MRDCEKREDGERNYSPVPAGMENSLARFGLKIVVFYENVRSGVKRFAKPRVFDYYCLAHLIGGDGYYYDHDSGTTVKLKPGDGILVCPGKAHEYGGREKCFIEDSICFSGSVADALKAAGIVRDGPLRLGSERRLLPIIQKTRDPGVASQFEANIMLQQLLVDLFRENSGNGEGSDRQLKRLLAELRANPAKWWTVEEMAEYCDISENRLRTLFRKATGMAPKRYIDELKMKKAIESLCGTRLALREIANCLGYADHYHFIRRFKSCVGVSPGRYRKLYSSMRGTRRDAGFAEYAELPEGCPRS